MKIDRKQFSKAQINAWIATQFNSAEHWSKAIQHLRCAYDTKNRKG